MLKKAAKAHETNAPQKMGKDLKSFRFPSSSPVAQKGDIRNHFGKKTASVAASQAKERAGSLQPLTVIPANAIRKPSGSRNNHAHAHAHAAGGGKLASLYGHSTSFDGPVHEEDVAPALPKSTARFEAGVALFDDDFDDTLELEFEEPTPLPTLPLAPQTAPAPAPASESARSSREEPVPWSTSPLSHFAPPQARSYSTASSTTLKRQSSGEDATPAEPPEPLVKKRRLPATWQKSAEVAHDVTTFNTPIVKPTYTTWESTASVEKERTKQLKALRQQKKEGAEGGEPSRKEMDDITRAHMSKAFTISLSKEQRHVLDLVVNGHQSVFFTGPAGTGKSVLMRAIISELMKKHAKEPERVAVTASTGLAACNIGGITLHSFSGIGLGKDDATTLVRKVKRNPKAKMRWLKTKCLIIDEISMVDGDLFDKLSQIGRMIRNNGRPWGGIQLVITGDFFQLPPVPESSNGGGYKEAKFAFDAATWNMSIDHTIGLTQVFRQKDPDFAGMLNEMRLGNISDRTVSTFKSLSRPLHFADGIAQTELFPRRQEVDYSNEKRLRELPGEMQTYPASDTGDQATREKLLQNMMAPRQLVLKCGAQVMLIKNIDEQLVNGTLGKVIDFADASNPAAGYDSDADDPISKARRKLKAFSHNPSAGTKKWPVVDFSLANGVVQRVLCEPHDWKVELPNGEVQASRKQVPLILAWALSIHKAQGQTLDRVRVDLSKVFEKGQAYVALSRATSREGLQVLGFEKSRVMAHRRVIEFYNRLYSVEKAAAMIASAQPVKSLAQPTVAQTLGMGASAKATMAQGQAAGQRTKQVATNITDLTRDEEDEDEKELLAAYGY